MTRKLRDEAEKFDSRGLREARREGKRISRYRAHRIMAAEEETAGEGIECRREGTQVRKNSSDGLCRLAWGSQIIFVIFGLTGMYLLAMHPDPGQGFIYMLGTLTGYAAK